MFNSETACCGFTVQFETYIPVTLTNTPLSDLKINDTDGGPFEKLN